MADLITGKVAAIENNYTVVINRGENHNVEKGMIFAIEDAKGTPVRDPDNPDEILDYLPVEKIKVKVIEVREKVCRAETYIRVKQESAYEAAARELLDDYRRQAALDWTRLARPVSSLDPEGKLRAALNLLQIGAATRSADERPAVVEVNVGDVARQIR